MRARAVKGPEIRLGELCRWHLVYAACGGCGRRRRIANDTLRRPCERDGNLPLNAFAGALRCQSCENERARVFLVELKPR